MSEPALRANDRANRWHAALAKDSARFLAFALVFAISYRFVFQFVYGRAHLDPAGYDAAVLSLPFLSSPTILLQLAGLAGLAWFLPKRLDWTTLSSGLPLRPLVLAIAFPLVWYLVTLDYNHVTDQGYPIDRIILLVAYVGIAVHPLAVPVFLLLAMNFLFQLKGPIPSFSTTDKIMLINLLTAFYVFLPMSLLVRRFKGHVFVFIAVAVVGCQYAHPALHKLMGGWMFHEQLDQLFLSAHVHGWWVSLDWPAVSEVAAWLRLLNPLLVVTTQALEFCGWLLLFHPRFTKLALLGLVGMHLGIVAASGIFFWKWIVVDVALAVVIHRMRAGDLKRVFGVKQGLAAALLILCAPLFMKTLKLTWFDTALTYHYSVEVTTTGGEVYEIAPLFFSPFDLPFTQNVFWFLEDRPVATTHFGKVKTAEHLALFEDRLDSIEPAELRTALADLEESIGEDRTQEASRERLRVFLGRFLRNVNARGKVGHVAPIPQAPHHILVSIPAERAYDFQAPIERFRVVKRVVYAADQPIEIRHELAFEEELHPD